MGFAGLVPATPPIIAPASVAWLVPHYPGVRYQVRVHLLLYLRANRASSSEGVYGSNYGVSVGCGDGNDSGFGCRGGYYGGRGENAVYGGGGRYDRGYESASVPA